MEEEKREGGGGSADYALTSRESEWCVASVAMKGLSWHISRPDRVPPLRGCAERMDGPSVYPNRETLTFPSRL